jgi:Lon protease-like protein
MSTFTIELPLFPLSVVLFPGTALPLHIFEPRYRQMIVDCEQESKPIGIVLARPESEHLQEIPHSVGTMAVIRNLERLPDGRYTLVAVGTRRFRILNQHRSRPYLSGLVEPFDDESEEESELPTIAERARTLFNRYLDMLLEAANEKDIELLLPEAAEELSYYIAYFLDIQNETKQRLLELLSTYQRLQDEVAILRREVPFMRQILSRQSSDEHSMLN